jgi:hypothetical protein
MLYLTTNHYSALGFQLADFSLPDLGIISKEFTIPVYFSGS